MRTTMLSLILQDIVFRKKTYSLPRRDGAPPYALPYICTALP